MKLVNALLFFLTVVSISCTLSNSNDSREKDKTVPNEDKAMPGIATDFENDTIATDPEQTMAIKILRAERKYWKKRP